jgi:hypothetical protein
VIMAWNMGIVHFWFSFETSSLHVSQVDLELATLLPQPSKYQHYRHAPLYLAWLWTILTQFKLDIGSLLPMSLIWLTLVPSDPFVKMTTPTAI